MEHSTLLDNLIIELEEQIEKSELMIKEFHLRDWETANKLFAGCKHELMFILKQLNPAGEDLLKVVNKLPENVSTAEGSILASLAGYVKTAHTIAIKLQKGQMSFSNSPFIPNKFSNKVFIVHGHDTEMLKSVNLFLRTIELNPIILHEQPNKGRTIIEKFVDYSDVGFAVVLLSPDDKTILNQKESSRARQNVIFELGYFIGKLGRDRVAALYKTGVEIPSDYSGVLYLEYNSSESWKFQLCKELRAAGFNIDLNTIFG